MAKTQVKRSKESYPECLCKAICGTGSSALDLLHDSYREQHPIDTEDIGRQFASLADILSKLPLKEHDRVWDLTCGLCVNHERSGFLEGIRLGVFPAAELLEKRYWKSQQ